MIFKGDLNQPHSCVGVKPVPTDGTASAKAEERPEMLRSAI